MKEYTTPNGKTIVVQSDAYGITVYFKEGGELPAELHGRWTDYQKAEMDILRYLAKVEPLHIQVKDENGIFQKVKNPKKSDVSANAS